MKLYQDNHDSRQEKVAATEPETGELKPCPFCLDGGEPYLNDVLYDARIYDIAVRCRRCGCSSTEYGWASGLVDAQGERYEVARRKAVEAWNTRVNSHAELERERDALAAALRELMNWGVEFDDERLGYISVQVDREAIKDAQRVLGETK